MADISAIALFCDDIREEKMGTHSIIGVFGDNITVPGFPGGMPKLGIYVRIHIPTDARPEKFEIYLNFPTGDRLLLNTIESELVKQTIEQAREAGNEIAGIYSQLIAAPFPVAQAGRVKVEIEWSSGRRVIGGLNFLTSEQISIDPNVSQPPS